MKQKPYKKIFKETSLKIHDTVKDYHNSQIDGYLSAYLNNVYVGKLDYSYYDGKGYIDYIEVEPEYRGQNIGMKMIGKLMLSLEVKYKDLEWGMMTPDGVKLKKKMDKFFHV